MLNKQEIRHAFQPVVCSQTKKTIGYEALLRHNLISNPLTLFENAREQDLLTKLDMMSIEKAVQTFHFQYGETLFLNVFPTTLLEPDFPYFLANLLTVYSVYPQQIIFEINETAEEKQVWSEPLLKETVELLRKNGFRVAMDDVGVGAASLKQVIEYKPDIIKLDRYFSQSLAKSKDKQAVLTFFVDYCSKKNNKLVLEGVEEQEDYEMAKELNVPFLQGYYVGKPRTYTEIENDRKLETISN